MEVGAVMAEESNVLLLAVLFILVCLFKLIFCSYVASC